MDEDRDKSLMRNQLIGIVLMTVLVFFWLNFFAPKRPPVQPQDAQTTQSESGTTQSGQSTSESPGAQTNQTAQDWPFLPSVPTDVEDPAEDEIVLNNKDLRLVFTRIGARLKRAELSLTEDGSDVVQLVPDKTGTADTDAVYPLGLRFPAQETLGDDLDKRRFNAEVDPAGHWVTFTLETEAAVFTKRFAFSDTPYVLDTDVTIRNLESEPRLLGRDLTPAYILNWGPDVASPDKDKGVRQSIVWRKDGDNEYQRTEKLKAADAPVQTQGVDWLAVRSAYFVVAMKPESEDNAKANAWYQGTAGDFRVGLAVPRFEIAADATQAQSFKLYIGPSKLSSLAAAWKSLDTAPRFFESSTWAFMDSFSKLLLRMLNYFYGIIPNYGVAIILLTIVVRVCMFPLTLKSMRSMKKMQLLAPEMEIIKEKYKDNPQEQQKKIMEMYRERGVNPMGGCLPMFLQMPVFIALYRMLWSAYELRGAPFILWIQDLSQPDHLLHTPFLTALPFVGKYLEYLNLLPFLMAGAMVVSQKVMPQSGPATNPQQKMMMTFMPIMFSVICYTMASGLNLYILVSTVLGIAQQAFTRVSKDVDISPVKPAASRKRQHFYTAAQERKRRMAKEAKAIGNKSGKDTPRQ